MHLSRVATALLLGLLMVVGTAVQARATTVPCGQVFVPDYEPVVTSCGEWGTQHDPVKPVFKDGRWVINDKGHEFTLMYNASDDEHAVKGRAMFFVATKGVDVRFGVAQPLDGTEPTPDYLASHTGLYVESEYTGDWSNFDLPQGH